MKKQKTRKLIEDPTSYHGLMMKSGQWNKTQKVNLRSTPRKGIGISLSGKPTWKVVMRNITYMPQRWNNTCYCMHKARLQFQVQQLSYLKIPSKVLKGERRRILAKIQRQFQCGQKAPSAGTELLILSHRPRMYSTWQVLVPGHGVTRTASMHRISNP